MTSYSKALILDRDGVINVDRGTYTFRKEDWTWMPGIIDLAKAASLQGYRIAVVTNQAGIARGRYGHEDVHALHGYMKAGFAEAGVAIDTIRYCPHYPEANGKCLCRKPGHLMVERALALLACDGSNSFMLGDRERDIISGQMAGCKTAYIGEGESLLADYSFRRPDKLIPFL